MTSPKPKNLYRPYLSAEEILALKYLLLEHKNKNEVLESLYKKVLKLTFQISESLISPNYTRTSQSIEEKLGLSDTESQDSNILLLESYNQKVIRGEELTPEESEQAKELELAVHGMNIIFR